MPLIKIDSIRKDRKVAVWKITESITSLRQRLSLDDFDQGLLDSFRSETKKLEWLTARILLKEVLARESLPYFGLTKDETGKPFLRNYSKEISISHSYPHVAAMMDNTMGVGIDIEQPKDKLRVIKHKFLSDSELSFVGDNVEKLCISWSAKEALYKIYGRKRLIFKENLELLPFDLESSGTITGNIIANGSIKSHKLHYEIQSDYVMVYNL